MKNFVIHQGLMLAKGSESYRLWEEKKWKELDAHQKRLHKEAVQRGEINEVPKETSKIS